MLCPVLQVLKVIASTIKKRLAHSAKNAWDLALKDYTATAFVLARAAHTSVHVLRSVLEKLALTGAKRKK